MAAAWEASEILVQIRTPKCVASGDVQCRARHERGHARGSRKVLRRHRRQEKRSTILVRDSSDYRWKLHLPKDYFVTAPPPPPGEFVVSPLDPSSERGPCAPPRGPFLKICFFRYTRLHTSRVRALETASFTLEGAAATCEETAMDETMVVLLTHGARQVERALRRALHCPQQHSKLPAPHLLALVP